MRTRPADAPAPARTARTRAGTIVAVAAGVIHRAAGAFATRRGWTASRLRPGRDAARRRRSGRLARPMLGRSTGCAWSRAPRPAVGCTRHGGVEVGLGRPHLHRDAEAPGPSRRRRRRRCGRRAPGRCSASTTSFISTMRRRGRRQRWPSSAGSSPGRRRRLGAGAAPPLRSGRRCRSPARRTPRSGWRRSRPLTGLPPNTVSAKAWPSRMATGVRLTRSVTSPTA